MYFIVFISLHHSPIALGEWFYFVQNKNLRQNSIMTFDKQMVSKDFSRSLDRFALALTQDLDKAADLVQQTLYKLLHKKDELQDEPDLLPLAITILKNLFYDDVRKKKEYQLSEDVDNDIATEGIEDQIANQETDNSMKDKINYCISKLSNLEREIVAYWQAGLSYQKVSENLQISLANARVKFNRSKESLRICLEAQGVG
tara:strand:- start:28 stop:630 length:603 start_codon:yes stop_codon:yes gene_type:complete